MTADSGPTCNQTSPSLICLTPAAYEEKTNVQPRNCHYWLLMTTYFLLVVIVRPLSHVSRIACLCSKLFLADMMHTARSSSSLSLPVNDRIC